MIVDEWCDTCQRGSVIVEEFAEQIGYEEQARPVWVVILECGHQIVTPSRWDA